MGSRAATPTEPTGPMEPTGPRAPGPQEATVAIVGGSISGLTAAILLGQIGIEVRVFERCPPAEAPLGAGLGVDLDLLSAITGDVEPRLPHLRLRERRSFLAVRTQGDRIDLPVTAHHLLRDYLRRSIAERKLVVPAEVTGLTLHDVEPLILSLGDGQRLRFGMVVGADGRQSVVRRAIAGDSAEPTYAGYVVWRGLVDESVLSAEARATFFATPALHCIPDRRQHLVAYPIPGRHGEVGDGARRLHWGWFLGARRERLGDTLDRYTNEAGELAATACAPPLIDDLLASVDPLWPPVIGEVLRTALDRGGVTLQPIFEAIPSRLAAAGAVLLGDAAHLASPITGSGARVAMFDALTLVRALVDVPGIDDALEAYEARRLPFARALVAQGRNLGWGF